MTTALAFITVVFLFLLIYLINKIQLDRKKFSDRITVLEAIIVQISKDQKAQNNQLKLSEDLKEKLFQINAKLSNEIYDVNFGLIEELYPRK